MIAKNIAEYTKTHLTMERHSDPIEGICPEGITILYANAKTGKSLFARSLAQAVVSAVIEGESDFLGFKINCTGPIIYFALDDTTNDITDRFNVKTTVWSNVDPHKAWLIDKIMLDKELKKYGGIIGVINSTIREITTTIGSPSIVIIDTFQKIRDYQQEVKYATEVHELEPLKMMAMESHYNLFLLHHETKGGTFYGSNGLIAEVNTILHLENVKGTHYQRLKIQGNSYSGEPELIIERDNDSLLYHRANLNNINLIDDIPTKNYNRLVNFMITAVRDRSDFKFVYEGALEDLIYDARLDQITNAGLSSLLEQYRECLRECGIEYSTTRPKNKIKVKIWIDKSEDYRPQDRNQLRIIED